MKHEFSEVSVFSPRKICVQVCDPCPLITPGLQKSFESDSKIKIMGESSSLQSLLDRVSAGGVDIALVDWSMIAWHDRECMMLVKEISSRSAAVLLGMNESTRDRKQALEFGARGIIDKRTNIRQMRQAICRVADGGIWLEKSAAQRMLNHVFSVSGEPQDELDRIDLLTKREREIITLVCNSLRNKEIASALSISESTVWHHLTSIFAKLKVADRISLVTFAIRHNLASYISKRPSLAKTITLPNRDETPGWRMPRQFSAGGGN